MTGPRSDTAADTEDTSRPLGRELAAELEAPRPTAVDPISALAPEADLSSDETLVLPTPGTAPAATPLDDPAAPDAPPASGRYLPGELVGQGGMARVLRARDRSLQRDVALKVLRGAPDPQARTRFLQEARVAGQLDHPHVLPVYDVGRDEAGAPFFTMRLVADHDTLADVIARLRTHDPRTQARYTFQRRVQVVQQVAEALHYAHERGVVHRDVKPQNVLIGPYGEVFLADWGVARLAAPSAPAPGAPLASLAEAPAPGDVAATAADGGADGGATDAAPAGGSGPLPLTVAAPEGRVDTGAHWLVGTLAYMAPEQLRDPRSVDARTDVYALCAVLYELLTLHYYLGPTTQDEVRTAIASRRPDPPERFRDPAHGRVPRSLSRVCERGLEKDPALRFQSAAELDAALQVWLEGAAPIVCPGTCLQRVLRRWSYLIDQRPLLVPVVSLLVFALFVSWVTHLARTAWQLLGS